VLLARELMPDLPAVSWSMEQEIQKRLSDSLTAPFLAAPADRTLPVTIRAEVFI
jgi:hypothetical protein